MRRIQQQVLGEASFATLARCVQTYETCRGLGLQPPLGDVRAGHLLGLAHVRPAKQRMLLRRVDEQRLSVEQLRQSTGRAGQRTRRGKPAVIKALDALRKHNLLEDVDSLQDLPRAEGKKVRQQVAQLRQELLTLEKQLRRLGFA